ncbi:MAG: transposase [Nanoarchaeota archaeon]|nr:transposase [Nanoarchaeota archaeon]
MSKSNKRKKRVQNYRCENGHSFNFQKDENYTNSFIEFVVFVYLNCLSLNITINIIRAYYEDDILSKATILRFLENTADEVPDIDSIDNIFHPKRSGYLALDGVWFSFRGRQVVMLVCFDPETFDVIEAIWSLEECEESYTQLLMKVSKKLGVKNIKGIYGDGDKGLMKALKTHFPLVPFQLCIVHKEMRMGQLVPVKSVNVSKRLALKSKKEILEFQDKFRAVIYAETKKESYLSLKELKHYVDNSDQERFKKAYRSLRHNFKYTLTHFDHDDMLRDNNIIECFNGIIKPRLKLMRGFKKYQNMDRYLKLFILNYRFHKLKESRFEERRGLCPLECAEVVLPEMNNFLTFLRNSLNLNYTGSSP